jgi:uncharacterized membrane protein
MKSKLASQFAALLVAVATCGGPVYAETTYRLTLLRPLVGSMTSQATSGINERGMAVGTSGGAGARRATVWSPQGAPTELAQPAGSIFSRATAINEQGTVVGAVDTTGAADLTGLRAVRWLSPRRYSFILPETGFDSDALSINDAGWVAGILFTGTTFTAFIASPERRIDYPAPLQNGDAFELLSINRKGEAAGFDASDVATTAVRWSPTRGLDALAMLPGGSTSASAAINDLGVASGVADDATGTFRAVRWLPDGRVVQLGSLPNAIYSDSQYSINNQGYSTGVTLYDGFDPDNYLSLRATLWTPRGLPIDLNSRIPAAAGVTLLTAASINDDGFIYGDCVTASGGRYAYLLTPVDEGGSSGGK